MPASASSLRAEGSPSLRWGVRVFVLTAFALTLWLAGPRAAAVLAARLEQAAHHSPAVLLDRVGFAARPDWMDRPLLLAVAAELSPWLQDEVPILDEVAMRTLRDGLQTVAWVREVAVERVFPDRFRLRLELRRPVLAVRDADGVGLCLVDRAGVVLPWVETPLPVTFLHAEGGAPTMPVRPGVPAAEVRVRAAAAAAVPGCPELIEVDATNLGERWMRGPSFPELRVRLRRNDGAGVTFAYDRPVDSRQPRVPVRTKAAVLAKILARHPGLQGLIAGDLRMARRWADYLQPRPAGVPDPIAPWLEPTPALVRGR
jgi:hypothetical protein